jgi:hypothetical protein
MSRRSRKATTIPARPMRPDADSARPLPLAVVPVPAATRENFPEGAYCHCYRLGECSVIVTREGGRWHLSIAHHARDPTWDEIAQARYRILPDAAWLAIVLPPRAEYVNLHRHCFQMVEIDPLPGDEPIEPR